MANFLRTRFIDGPLDGRVALWPVAPSTTAAPRGLDVEHAGAVSRYVVEPSIDDEMASAAMITVSYRFVEERRLLKRGPLMIDLQHGFRATPLAFYP